MRAEFSIAVIRVIVASAAAAGVCGCAAQDTSSSVSAGQDKALNDPMNYSPDMKNTDIMGGGVGTYDPNAMKRDLDDVFFIP
jgi:type IV pilus biogenesis protein CpaD/CtpE